MSAAKLVPNLQMQEKTPKKIKQLAQVKEQATVSKLVHKDHSISKTPSWVPSFI